MNQTTEFLCKVEAVFLLENLLLRPLTSKGCMKQIERVRCQSFEAPDLVKAMSCLRWYGMTQQSKPDLCVLGPYDVSVVPSVRDQGKVNSAEMLNGFGR